ncbi:acetyl-CoA C-acetyltransferase [Rickettsiales endosymbiont of Peranema trichophorum]|uniref:acetyl-CoA C-acetyltransferase n=1 Tax=Rickettsiales endosymbiont of Peranema trichophorum TaxID=2486577 RepID=UPI001023C367|nr:acetyl-CoA C-acetyltransferase [Rickettsiales endosymbiont of Peranema trichophorum]RZI45160.1 acetyl-CoA C-acetyltransferase [Rickettsiales endosymbiont of Peranema trichophorum]
MEVVIVSALRTAIGSFNGALSTTETHKLGGALIRQTLAKTNVQASEVSEVIIGQVLTAGAGQNPTRQSAIEGKIPVDVPAFSVNQVCGSGLKAIALGYQSILLGQSRIVIAGGQENMSMSLHGMNIRGGKKMGNATLIDLMINDGLFDAFEKVHMGITAEKIAESFGISRHDQDQFTVDSQAKAMAAQKSQRFKEEIVPIMVRTKQGMVPFQEDEYIKGDVTCDGLSKLKPAFKEDGTVTAGNASGINDGAAIVMLMSREEAVKRGLEILGSIKSFAQVGVEPIVMGTGPVPASKKALELCHWSINDLELIEANEAFAAQALYVNRTMNWDTTKVNVNGGAIALGHPIGASGARILVTLLHEMQKRGVHKGLATLCVGGGMGVAMCVER